MPLTVPCRLLADRVLCDGSDRALDLVTGSDVLLRIEAVGAAVEQRTWAEACARWYVLRHARVPVLCDYGVIGAQARFEAIAAPRTTRARTRRPAGVPATAGADGGGVQPSRLRRAHRLQPRRAVERVGAWMEDPHAGMLRELHVCGPRGSGLSTAADLMAREGRLRGFVPARLAVLARLSAAVRDEALRLLSMRHTLLLRDLRNGCAGEGAVLETFARIAERPILVVTFGRDKPRNRPFVALDPLDVQALERMIGLDRAAPRQKRRFRACAERSSGWPGRFLAEWHRGDSVPYTIGQTQLLRVAERAPVYSAPATDRRDPAVDGAEEAEALHAIARAARMAAAGRHAAARTTLREVAAQHERRGCLRALAHVRLALGRLAHARGAIAEAIAELDAARASMSDETPEEVRADATVALCRALIDHGELRRAEIVARVAHASARARPSSACVLAAALFWQGRYDEAEDVLNGSASDDTPMLALRARIALARGELSDAAALAHRALEPAPRGECGEARLAACVAAMIVSGAAADTARVGELSASACALARAAHQPMWTLEIRLARVEALIRGHDLAGARSAARGLARLAARRALPLTSARVRTLRAAIEAAPLQAADHEGFQALADLHAALTPGSARSSKRRIRDDLVRLLELVQEAPDERSAIEGMTAFVAGALRHASVGVFAKDGPEVTRIATSHPSSPARPPDVALRALAAGILVGPSRGHEGVDVAIPIRFAGSIAGVLCCRWAVEGPLDWTRIEVLLAAAATAAGPCLRAAVDRGHEQARTPVAELIGGSEAMRELRDLIGRAAAAPFAVLVEGESGAGKELVARAIHRASPRRDRKWCAINCAALSDDLLEAELFGHARGAFTGALADRPGLFEEADGGTLFLDEVGELSPRAQAKLLRTLQEGEVRRLGENATRRVDVRVVAATNRHLADEVARGRFREDLWYRLAIIRIAVPPLRTRPEDVPALVGEFWRRAAERIGSRAVIAAPTLAALARYDWPGNVRELQNVLAALSVAAPRRGTVMPAHLPDAILRTASPPSSLEAARRSFDERFIRAALARAGGRIGVAARELGISRQGLTKLIARLAGPPPASSSTAEEARKGARELTPWQPVAKA